MASLRERLRDAARAANSKQYDYQGLPTSIAFRVAELLPGRLQDIIKCRLHVAEWSEIPAWNYEAISYTWGDPNLKVPILVDEKPIHITKNLHAAFKHFRYEDRSRADSETLAVKLY